MRLANMTLAETMEACSTEAGRTATADHPRCSSSNAVGSRSHSILAGFKKCSTAIPPEWLPLNCGDMLRDNRARLRRALSRRHVTLFAAGRS
jgi:hypothetical protein